MGNLQVSWGPFGYKSACALGHWVENLEMRVCSSKTRVAELDYCSRTFWAAVQELELSHYSNETLLFTIYPYYVT